VAKAVDPNFLRDFQPEEDWARDHGVTRRTARRYRAAGLRYLNLGGIIYIDKRHDRSWIDGRVRSPVRPRIRQRRTS
jgi:hypothetical protein